MKIYLSTFSCLNVCFYPAACAVLVQLYSFDDHRTCHDLTADQHYNIDTASATQFTSKITFPYIYLTLTLTAQHMYEIHHAESIDWKSL